jgi:uncharacterized membrane protein
LPFNTVIFLAGLWALSSEMVEDSLVDLVYGHIYGWRALVYALVSASIVLASISAILIYYSLTILVQYIAVVTKGSAILLGLIGLFWLVSSILGIVGRTAGLELEEIRKSTLAKSEVRNFLIAFQLVSIEELEILLIIIPLVVASHGLEASLAATIGVLASLTTAALLRRSFERLVAGKLPYLKLASGAFLVGLGSVLFLQV